MLAGDGSTLNLPSSKQIRSYFGVEASSVNRSLARIFLIYDVITGFTLQARLGRTNTGEASMLEDCLRDMHSRAGDLLVLDRNFGYYTTVHQLAAADWDFCIRMSTGMSAFAKSAMADRRMDFVTEWVPSRSEVATARAKAPVRVRVTKAILETGETELLVSSLLDMEAVSSADMAELYAMRWGVEEGIKNLKPKMKVEQFGCRKPEGIYQEFYAHILAMNMVALAGMAAQKVIKKKTARRKLNYRYNWKNAFRYLRDITVGLFSQECAEKLLEKLVGNIISSVIAIRKGRKFSRQGLGKATRINQYYK